MKRDTKDVVVDDLANVVRMSTTNLGYADASFALDVDVNL